VAPARLLRKRRLRPQILWGGPEAAALSDAGCFYEGMMFEWIKQNAQVLSVITNLGMLAVWVLYAQLLFSNFRRARRARIIINQGVGTGARAHCLISNMSQEPIFVECIVAKLEMEGQAHTSSVTEYRHTGDDTKAGLHDRTGQGPLKTGEYLDLGTFEDIARRVLDKNTPEDDDSTPPFQAIELFVVAIYGPETSPIGASRRFELKANDQKWLLTSATIDSVALTSRRDRRRMRRWLAQYS
jgi:hypothetical protein